MGAFWAAVMVMIGPIVYRVATSIGLGFVTYKGVDLLMDQLRGHIESQFGGLPSQMLALAGLMHIDTAVSLILSAVGVRAFLAGWDALGEKRHPVWRKPGGDGSQEF